MSKSEKCNFDIIEELEQLSSCFNNQHPKSTYSDECLGTFGLSFGDNGEGMETKEAPPEVNMFLPIQQAQPFVNNDNVDIMMHNSVFTKYPPEDSKKLDEFDVMFDMHEQQNSDFGKPLSKYPNFTKRNVCQPEEDWIGEMSFTSESTSENPMVFNQPHRDQTSDFQDILCLTNLELESASDILQNKTDTCNQNFQYGYDFQNGSLCSSNVELEQIVDTGAVLQNETDTCYQNFQYGYDFQNGSLCSSNVELEQFVDTGAILQNETNEYNPNFQGGSLCSTYAELEQTAETCNIFQDKINAPDVGPFQTHLGSIPVVASITGMDFITYTSENLKNLTLDSDIPTTTVNKNQSSGKIRETTKLKLREMVNDKKSAIVLSSNPAVTELPDLDMLVNITVPPMCDTNTGIGGSLVQNQDCDLKIVSMQQPVLQEQDYVIQPEEELTVDSLIDAGSKTKIHKSKSKEESKTEKNKSKSEKEKKIVSPLTEEEMRIYKQYEHWFKGYQQRDRKNMTISNFLIHLLRQDTTEHLIRWINRKELQFEILDSKVVPTLYHVPRNNNRRNYDTFARCIRSSRQKNSMFAPSWNTLKRQYQFTPKALNAYNTLVFC